MAPCNDTLTVAYTVVAGDGTAIRQDVTRRPEPVAFKPQRVLIEPPASPDWVILDIGVVHVVDDSLVADAYQHDRRKAGRKIRQNRRKNRRLAAGRFIAADERTPESVDILIRRKRLPLGSARR